MHSQIRSKTVQIKVICHRTGTQYLRMISDVYLCNTPQPDLPITVHLNKPNPKQPLPYIWQPEDNVRL